VVVGWGQPLDIHFIVLVDDVVAASDWEQDLYRMGVPPEMDVHFESVESAISRLAAYQTRPDAGIVLTADVGTMRRLVDGAGTIRRVNIGGIHHREGRDAKLRYVFLSSDESAALRSLAAQGVTVSAQDVPATTPVPLEQVLAAVGE
jgi:PTS system mannose-specific IIB component/fructoselysine and glucoselysine-specific PTS system IIB component